MFGKLLAAWVDGSKLNLTKFDPFPRFSSVFMQHPGEGKRVKLPRGPAAVSGDTIAGATVRSFGREGPANDADLEKPAG